MQAELLADVAVSSATETVQVATDQIDDVGDGACLLPPSAQPCARKISISLAPNLFNELIQKLNEIIPGTDSRRKLRILECFKMIILPFFSSNQHNGNRIANRDDSRSSLVLRKSR